MNYSRELPKSVNFIWTFVIEWIQSCWSDKSCPRMNPFFRHRPRTFCPSPSYWRPTRQEAQNCFVDWKQMNVWLTIFFYAYLFIDIKQPEHRIEGWFLSWKNVTSANVKINNVTWSIQRRRCAHLCHFSTLPILQRVRYKYYIAVLIFLCIISVKFFLSRSLWHVLQSRYQMERKWLTV